MITYLADAPAQGVDWQTLISTVISVIGALAAFGAWAKRAFVHAVNAAMETEDGSVVQILQRNTKTLGDLADEFERLAVSVREVKNQHSNMETRLARLEQQNFGRRSRW